MKKNFNYWLMYTTILSLGRIKRQKRKLLCHSQVFKQEKRGKGLVGAARSVVIATITTNTTNIIGCGLKHKPKKKKISCIFKNQIFTTLNPVYGKTCSQR